MTLRATQAINGPLLMLGRLYKVPYLERIVAAVACKHNPIVQHDADPSQSTANLNQMYLTTGYTVIGLGRRREDVGKRFVDGEKTINVKSLGKE